MAQSMSHRDEKKRIKAFQNTTEVLRTALAQGDLSGIDRLAGEHTEAFKGLVTCGPFTDPDDYQMLLDLKEAVDRTYRALGEQKNLLFSRIMTSRKKHQCLKAYHKKGF